MTSLNMHHTLSVHPDSQTIPFHDLNARFGVVGCSTILYHISTARRRQLNGDIVESRPTTAVNKPQRLDTHLAHIFLWLVYLAYWMADDLYNLEVLSTVSKITQEILNHTGANS